MLFLRQLLLTMSRNRFATLSKAFSSPLHMIVKKHDMHVELKSYKFKLLKKSIIQLCIKACFGSYKLKFLGKLVFQQ